MSSSPPLLEVQGLSRRFPGVLALDHMDFDVLPGEVHALVGENGAGKSTLINTLGASSSHRAARSSWAGNRCALPARPAPSKPASA